MDFVSNQPEQIKEMLKAIGMASIDELFSSIPEKLKHPAPKKEDGMSEAEILPFMEALGNKNLFLDSYLGGGAYAHHIPALVEAIISRSEFLTSYTPYQPEISQGMLQATFEFQSAIAALTWMEVANAGVYDGASACAEAVLMALRIHKEKRKILVASSLHPGYLSTLKLYLKELNVEIELLPFDPSGKINLTSFSELIDEKTAAVLIQSPNFFGVIEEMPHLAEKTQAKQALFIACGNPLSYALLKPPGEYGADIAVGDTQPFGLPLHFGGPYSGYMACKEMYVRQLPGRLVGETVDSKNQRGFVLTLQAREQHIRREKATSNICTNQALATLASLVTLMWYGPVGLNKLALTNYQRAHYLSTKLSSIKGFSVLEPFFNEFTLKIPCEEEHFFKHFRSHNIEPGISLTNFFPSLQKHILIAVTELKTLEQLNKFVEVAKKL